MSSSPPFRLPDPRLREVDNRTPFTAFQCDKMGPGRRFYDTLVIKGTFTGFPDGLRLADQQGPVVLADTPWDQAAPERSSVKLAGDAVLIKPSTDILITGKVQAPGGRPSTGWEVTVAVQGAEGRILEYQARVTGPRSYRHSTLRGWVLGDPEPTTEVPIRYELAYGGAYADLRSSPAEEPRWVTHWPNPSGVGFFDESAMNPALTYPAAQWHPPGRPVRGVQQEVPLAGLGPIARPWTARQRYVGTCDDAWLKRAREDIARGLPADYPADFDLRFFQSAHPGLIAREYLTGGEVLGLSGVSSEREWLVVPLPGVALRAELLDGEDRWHERRLPLDTVHLDLDAGLLHLCWRLTLEQERDLRVAVISVQEAS